MEPPARWVWGFLLGGPAGAGQDHPHGCLSGSVGDEPGPLSARRDRGRPGRQRGPGRSELAHARLEKDLDKGRGLPQLLQGPRGLLR